MDYKVVVTAEAEEDLNLLNVCDNPRLQSLGYRRINFQQHRYFMLYRIENDVVYVDDIFHELQDYENRMI